MTRLSRRELLGMLAGAGAAAALPPRVGPGVARAAEAPKRGGQVVGGLSPEPTGYNPLPPHLQVDRGGHFGLFDKLLPPGPRRRGSG